jgi:Fur family ferric uptake transcriptional regulator
MISSTQTNHPMAGIPQAEEATVVTTSRDAICNRLRSAGLRSTQPRIAIFKALNEFSEPASIEQIYRSIKSTSCDLVTVYRGLALFEELGLVQRTFSNNGTGLYQLKREGQPTDYVSCKQTSRREIIDEQDAQELHRILSRIESSLAQKGYKNVSHRLEFQGLATNNPHSAEAQPVQIQTQS